MEGSLRGVRFFAGAPHGAKIHYMPVIELVFFGASSDEDDVLWRRYRKIIQQRSTESQVAVEESRYVITRFRPSFLLAR